MLLVNSAQAHMATHTTPLSSGSASGGITLSIAVSETVKARTPWPTAYLKITNVSNGAMSIDPEITEEAMAHAFRASCTKAHGGEKHITYDPELMSGPTSIENGKIVYRPIVLTAGQSYWLPYSILITLEQLVPGESCELQAHLLVRLLDGRTIPIDSGIATFTAR